MFCFVVLFLHAVDTVPPVCSGCNADITETISLNVGGTNIQFTECTATDNSGSVALTSRSHGPNERFNTGTTRVEYVFTDPSDNSVTCGFTVTIIEGSCDNVVFSESFETCTHISDLRRPTNANMAFKRDLY